MLILDVLLKRNPIVSKKRLKHSEIAEHFHDRKLGARIWSQLSFKLARSKEVWLVKVPHWSKEVWPVKVPHWSCQFLFAFSYPVKYGNIQTPTNVIYPR